MENYDYLADLVLDQNTNLYNLFLSTYNGNSVTLFPFFCNKKHNMRLDLISYELYGSNKYVGTLCQLNNILNPFSIQEGDILFYTTVDQLEGLMRLPEYLKQSDVDQLLGRVKSDLINSMKNRKNDSNRMKYRRGVDKLPPTVLPSNVPQIVIDNDKIRIAPNLFNQPASEQIDSNSNTNNDTSFGSNINGNGGNSGNGANDRVNIERILVNRYIKKIGN